MHLQCTSIRRLIGTAAEQALPGPACRPLPSGCPLLPDPLCPSCSALSPFALAPSSLAGFLVSSEFQLACQPSQSSLLTTQTCFPIVTVYFSLFHFLHGTHHSLTLPCLVLVFLGFFACLLSVSKVNMRAGTYSLLCPQILAVYLARGRCLYYSPLASVTNDLVV